MNRVRAELLKIRTTNLWWVFALSALALQALAFLVNALQAAAAFSGSVSTEGVPADQLDEVLAQNNVVYQVANLYTTGQFFALLFVMLLGIILVTNEFHHQTATTTFLTTPHRTSVIVAKLVAATVLGAALWLVSTLINIVATVIFLNIQDQATHLGDGAIIRAIFLNLLAYVLWGIFGVGFGVLIRSQIGATVTAVVLYLVGTTAAGIIFFLLESWLGWDWIDQLQVIVPSIASGLMITGTDLPGSPPQWVGAVVLIAYAVVTGLIGTLLIRRRDIS